VTRGHSVRSQTDLGSVVLDELTRDEKRLRTYISKRLERGADIPNSLLRAVELFAARAEEEVQMPKSVEEIQALSTDELIALIRKLERDMQRPPCPHCGCLGVAAA
jgi:hypothetical protein